MLPSRLDNFLCAVQVLNHSLNTPESINMDEWIASTKTMEIFICAKSWLWPSQDWDLFTYFIYILCLIRHILWNLFSYSAIMLCNIIMQYYNNIVHNIICLQLLEMNWGILQSCENELCGLVFSCMQHCYYTSDAPLLILTLPRYSN